MAAAAPPHGVNPVRRRRVDALRLILALTLAASAGFRLSAPNQFAAFLTGLGMLTAGEARWLVYVVPAGELALAALLALGRAPAFAASITLVYALGFLGVHGYVFMSGEVIPCGCVGVQVANTGRGAHLVMAAIWTAVACGAAVLLLTCRRPRLGGAPLTSFA